LATDTVTYGETEEKVGEQMKRLSDKAKAAGNKTAGAAMIVLGVSLSAQRELSAQAYLTKPRCTELAPGE